MKLCYPITGPESKSISMAMGGDFESNLKILHQIGYKGIELMTRDPKKIDVDVLYRQLKCNELEIAAVGVAPMVTQDGLTLANNSKPKREEAIERAKDAIDLASHFKAPFCIGSFRGFIDEEDENNNLFCALQVFKKICRYAQEKKVLVLMEPQGLTNGNYINTIDQGLSWIEQVDCDNLYLILDFFHIADNEMPMFKNMERIKNKYKLVHVCDSKRYLMGYGNLPIVDFISMLISQGYEGYFSTEIKQLPDCVTAAKMTFSFFDYLQRVILSKD